MYRIKIRRLISLLGVMAAFHVSWNSAFAQQSLADSPAGKSLAELIDILNNDDDEVRAAFWKDGFAANNEEAVTLRMTQTDQVRSRVGKIKFKQVVKSSDRKISAICATETGPDVIFKIAISEPPVKIEKVALEIVRSGDDGGNAEPLDADIRTDVLEKLTSELRAKYVHPDVAEKMVTAIKESVAAGEYDELEDARLFASLLNDQLGEISRDRRLRVRARPASKPGQRAGNPDFDNHGFVKAEMLPGRIGYLRLDRFSEGEDAKKTASAAMQFLSKSKILIFDLRENGGGSREMIAYLSSYLFDEPVHLTNFYNRPEDTTTETWTQQEVPGHKFSPETKIFVLTSRFTFSGAEEFSYNLQNLKRATIVGETTSGGGHPAMPVELGSQFHVMVPYAQAINPITKTNWEGVGVKPNVEIAALESLEKALSLAKGESTDLAAKEPEQSGKTEAVQSEFDQLVDKAEGLMDEENFSDAAKVFAEMTSKYPKNGAAWFRYGYCLHVIGDLDRAIEVHRKASEFEQFAAMANYNLACALSIKNQVDDAFAALLKAIELGFNDMDQLETDPDFDKLREDARFKKLVEKIKGDG